MNPAPRPRQLPAVLSLVGVRRLALMACLLLSSTLLAADSEQVILNESYPAGSSYMGIRLLGTVELLQQSIDGLPLVELSALAWDEDRKLLYAASDNGYLYHLQPRFEDGMLVGVSAVAGFQLMNRHGQRLRGKFADSEGMLLLNGADGDPDTAELLICFERRPRVSRFTPQGRWLGDVAIPPLLAQRGTYTTENKALEGIANHPRWGLLTAPEWPLRGAPDTRHYPIVQLSSDRRWRYPRFPAPKAGLVAMEALPDGGLLTLERAYVSIWQPIVIVLRRSQPLPAPGEQPWQRPALQADVVAEFNSGKGWILDNFEGLAHHRGQRFFMVSDNNRRALQRTLLFYFEVLDPSTPETGRRALGARQGK